MNIFRFVFGLFLVLIGSTAFAGFPPPSNTKYSFTHSSFVSPFDYSSAQSACAALVSRIQGLGTHQVEATGSATETGCPYRTKDIRFPNNQWSNDIGQIKKKTVTECPPGSALVGNFCVCDKGKFERPGEDGGTMCVAPDGRTPEQVCDDEATLWNSTLNPDRGMRIQGSYGEFAEGGVACNPVAGKEGASCKHWFTSDLGFKDDKGADWVNGFSIGLNKGDPRAGGSLSCTPSDKTQEKPPADCKDGYKGTVNGVDVCVDAWTGETNTSDWTRTRGTDGTDTTTVTNINCKGDQCTVTERNTSKDANGNITNTTTTTTPNVDRQAYCARNPESAICGRKDDISGGDKGSSTRPNGNGKGGEDGEGEDVVSPGAPGGGKVTLWEKKYPQGVSGVWDARSAELKSTPLGGLATQLLPNFGDGGTPPVWTFDLNFGGVFDFGNFTLDVDSRVWLALKAFTIICALALARKLVFGG